MVVTLLDAVARTVVVREDHPAHRPAHTDAAELPQLLPVGASGRASGAVLASRSLANLHGDRALVQQLSRLGERRRRR